MASRIKVRTSRKWKGIKEVKGEGWKYKPEKKEEESPKILLEEGDREW